MPNPHTVPQGALSMHGWRIAAPSWVIADSLAANCRFLEGRVSEVGLLFFETTACLAYTEKDLPADMASLSLAWHAHLPLDLPWEDAETTADICLSLMDNVDFLGVRRAVLHPPVSASMGEAAPRALEYFARRWRMAGRDMRDCLLENIHGEDLTGLWPTIRRLGFAVCLDIGHLLAYRQERLLALPDLRAVVRMVHLNAPGPGGRHLPLTALSSEDGERVARVLQTVCGTPDTAGGKIGGEPVLMMEVFDWAGFVESLPVLNRMLIDGGTALPGRTPEERFFSSSPSPAVSGAPLPATASKGEE